MSGSETRDRIKANTCNHCGEWLIKVHELNGELIKKEAEILRLKKEVNDLMQKGLI